MLSDRGRRGSKVQAGRRPSRSDCVSKPGRWRGGPAPCAALLDRTRPPPHTGSAERRHPSLQHLAAAGRTAPELQAKSRHQHLASLGVYVRLGTETAARITAEHEPAARRRHQK